MPHIEELKCGGGHDPSDWYYLRIIYIVLEYTMWPPLAMVVMAALSALETQGNIVWRIMGGIGWFGTVGSFHNGHVSRYIVVWLILAHFGSFSEDQPCLETLAAIYITCSCSTWLPPSLDMNNMKCATGSNIGKLIMAAGPVSIVVLLTVQLTLGIAAVPFASTILENIPHLHLTWLDTNMVAWPLCGVVCFGALICGKRLAKSEKFEYGHLALALILYEVNDFGTWACTQINWPWLRFPGSQWTVQGLPVFFTLWLQLLTLGVGGEYKAYGDSLSITEGVVVESMKWTIELSERLRPTPIISHLEGVITYIDSENRWRWYVTSSFHPGLIVNGQSMDELLLCSLVTFPCLLSSPSIVGKGFWSVVSYIGWAKIGEFMEDGEYSATIALPSLLVAFGSPFEGPCLVERRMVLYMVVYGAFSALPLFISTTFVNLGGRKPYAVASVVQLCKIHGPFAFYAHMAAVVLIISISQTVFWWMPFFDPPQDEPLGENAVYPWVALGLAAVSVTLLFIFEGKYALRGSMGAFGTGLTLVIWWVCGDCGILNTLVGQICSGLAIILVELIVLVGYANRQRRLYPERYVDVDTWRVNDFWCVFARSHGNLWMD